MNFSLCAYCLIINHSQQSQVLETKCPLDMTRPRAALNQEYEKASNSSTSVETVTCVGTEVRPCRLRTRTLDLQVISRTWPPLIVQITLSLCSDRKDKQIALYQQLERVQFSSTAVNERIYIFSQVKMISLHSPNVSQTIPLYHSIQKIQDFLQGHKGNLPELESYRLLGRPHWLTRLFTFTELAKEHMVS